MTPIPTRTPIKPPDYMEFASKSSDAQASKYVRVLLVGDIGTGKTHLIGTAPSPLIIDVDEGTRTVAHKDLEIIRVPFGFDRKENRKNNWKVYKTLVDIILDAQTLSGPFAPGERFADIKTLAMDGYTALAMKLMNEIQISAGQDPLTDKPQYDEWNELQKRLISITEELKKVPMNVIATANTMMEKDEATGRYFGFPSIIGGFRNLIGRFFDEVYYIETEAKKQGDGYNVAYRCFTKPTRYFAAKSRTDLPTMVESITFDQIEKAWNDKLKEDK